MIFRVRPVYLFAPATVLAVACGPSFQAVYEGNARFEHCYALEENTTSSMPDRASCWRDWSERYTYGQTRDRIHYATARYVALSQGLRAPTDEALMMAAPGETPRVSTITAPTPTSALAPPPKVLDPGLVGSQTITPTPGHPGEANGKNSPDLGIDGGVPSPAKPMEPKLPSSTCSDTCGGEYHQCGSMCGADAGTGTGATAQSPKCQACTRTYKTCMRNCFK